MFDLVGVQRTLATYFSGSAPSSRIEHADRQPHRSPDPVGLVRDFTIEREADRWVRVLVRLDDVGGAPAGVA